MRNFLLFSLLLFGFTSHANDECANAIQLTPGTTCNYTTGSFNGATLSGTAPSCAGQSLQDVWYKFTATDATMRISLSDVSGLNHGFQVLQGGCGGTVMACVNEVPALNAESYTDNTYVIGQEYYIRVFNATAQFSSASFGICVINIPPPVNDLCANAQQLTPGTTCTYTQGTFSGSLKDGGIPSCATNASQDVWYKFTATDVTMRIELDSSSNVNHGFEVYQGGCSGTLVACVNDVGTGLSESYFNNNFIAGQEYYVRVINAAGSTSTRTFSICITKYPTPANDLCANAQQLTPGNVCTYTPGTFSGSLKDGNIPSCATTSQQDVWYKFTATDAMMSIELDGTSNLNHGFEVYQGGCEGTLVTCTNLYGTGTAESYFSTNFIAGQEYYIRVINASGSLSTRYFNICIRNYPTPANDLCANATEVFPGTTCNYIGGTFSGSANDGTASACPSGNIMQDIWYKFVATEQTYSIYLNPVGGFNPGFQIFEGGCDGTLLACVNSNGNGTSEYYQNYNFVIGQTYYVRFFHGMNGYASQNISFCITKYPKPSNDACQNARVLYQNTACSEVGATLTGAMFDGPAISCAPQAGQDVWFRFIAEGNSANIYIGPMIGRDLGYLVYEGGCNGTPIACINNSGPNLSETAIVSNLTQGQEYYIQVFNAYQGPTIDSFSICVYGAIQPCNASVSIAASTNQICTGGIVTFTATPVNGGATPQYQWKRNGNNVGTNSPVFTATNLVNGDNISVVMTSSVLCPSVPTVTSNIITMNVTSPVVPAFTQVSGICTGGTFTLPTTSNNGITGTWNPAIDNTATTTYTFIPNSGQCASTATMTVAVNNNVAPIFNQVAPICQGGSFTLPVTSTNGITGTWSPAINNNATTTYTFTPNAGQCAIAATMTVTVNNNIAPIFNQVSPICQGGTFTLPVTSTNGITGTWSPAINNNATTTYTFTPNAGQCAIAATMTVTVNNNVAPTFNQVAPICQGGTFTLPTTSTNGITGTWSPIVNNSATTTYTFTPNPGQCAVATTMTVTVNNNVTPLFNQIAPICQGGTFTLPVTSTNGIIGTWSPIVNNSATTTYTFTPNPGQCAVAATMTVTVNNNVTPLFNQVAPICQGGTFTLPATSTNGIIGTWSPAVNNNATTTYTFTPNPGQCAVAATMTVTVNNNVTPLFNQIAPICQGGTFTLPTTSTNGIAGTWSPAVNNNATTTYTFTPNTGQCAVPATMTVTVNNNVTPIFNQVAPICQGGSFILPTTSTNGITGTWSPALNNNATTTYTFTPNPGQCAVPATMTVTVNNNVTPIFNQVAPICQGGSFTLPTTSINGIAGTWSPAVNNNATTTYTFTPNPGQCAMQVSMTVVINSINTGVTVAGATIIASATDATYQWINCTSNELINTATSASFTAVENGSYAVIVTQNGCSSMSECITISNLTTEIFSQIDWKIYPNPVTDQLFIEASETTAIILTDVAGKIISSHDLRSGVNTISTGSLSAGVYFIKSISGIHAKFIKK